MGGLKPDLKTMKWNMEIIWKIQSAPRMLQCHTEFTENTKIVEITQSEEETPSKKFHTMSKLYICLHLKKN